MLHNELLLMLMIHAQCIHVLASKRLEALAVRLEAVADRKRGRGGASGDGERVGKV